MTGIDEEWEAAMTALRDLQATASRCGEAAQDKATAETIYIRLRKDYNPRPDFKQTAEPSSLNPLEYKLAASRGLRSHDKYPALYRDRSRGDFAGGPRGRPFHCDRSLAFGHVHDVGALRGVENCKCAERRPYDHH